MRRFSFSLAAAVCAVTFTAAPAHAQLMKRIKQAAADKIADKAVDKAVGSSSDTASAAPPDASGRVNRGSQGVYGPQRASASTSTKIEITSERVIAFISAMEPVLAAGREIQAQRDAEQREKTYHACSANAMLKGPGQMTKAQEAESDRIADQISKLTDQMLAASGAQNSTLAMQLTDSIQVLADKQQRLIYPAIGKCGARPAKRSSGSAARMDAGGSITNPAPSRIPGMSAGQFGLMRERIAMYLIAPDRPNNLSPDEKNAIDSHSKELGDIAAGFKSNLYNWQTWSEIWSAWK